MKKMVFIWPVLILIGSGCSLFTAGRREVTGPAQALVGYWKMTEGGGEVYFTRGGIYSFVDRDGNSGRATYRVTEADPETRTVTTVIRLTEYNQRPVEEEIEMTVTGTFSENYRTHTGESVESAGSRPFVMEYVEP